MSIIIKLPQGPIRPVVEALEENEILHGWVTQLEDSATRQLSRLQDDGADIIEEGDQYYEIYHGLDGTAWALDHLFSQYFPGLQRAAAFLVIWGSFERHMNELCREVALAGSYRVAVEDLSGTGLTRARTYLLKVAGLDGAWADAQWQEFPEFQRIRNLFAHGDGSLDPKNAKLVAYVERSLHITVQNNTVQLAASFLPHLLNTKRHFLHGLEEGIVKRFGR